MKVGVVREMKSANLLQQSEVIVAMSGMWMVQPASDQIIRVIAVWYGFVAAPGTVLVRGRMVLPGWLATLGVRSVHWEGVLVVVAFVRMMQVAVMQVIDVPVVFDSRVSATDLVLVSVMIARHFFPFQGGCQADVGVNLRSVGQQGKPWFDCPTTMRATMGLAWTTQLLHDTDLFITQ
jgi:hypothetical protein